MITSWPALAAFTPPLMPCKEHGSLVHCHGHGLIQLYCLSSELDNIDRNTCAGHKTARSSGEDWPMPYIYLLQPQPGGHGSFPEETVPSASGSSPART